MIGVWNKAMKAEIVKGFPGFTDRWTVESEGIERRESCRQMVTVTEMVEGRVCELRCQWCVWLKTSSWSLESIPDAAWIVGYQDLSRASIAVHCASPLIWHFPSGNCKLVTLPEKYHEIYTFKFSFVMTLPRTVSACVHVLLLVSHGGERLHILKTSWSINML